MTCVCGHERDEHYEQPDGKMLDCRALRSHWTTGWPQTECRCAFWSPVEDVPGWPYLATVRAKQEKELWAKVGRRMQ